MSWRSRHCGGGLHGKGIAALRVALILSCAWACGLPVGRVWGQAAREWVQALPKRESGPEAGKRRLRALATLPVFDDFSGSHPSAGSGFWAGGGGATQSLRQAIAPPTVGVLTFDAARGDGLLYPGAGRVPFAADTLLSRPIEMPNGGDTTVYLSFLFQPGGHSDAPGRGDSLLLDFYSPARLAWRTVWRASYDAERKVVTQHYQADGPRPPREVESVGDDPQGAFHRMHIPVRGEAYLGAGFRFRLRNYASIPQETTTPGRSSNASHWHVDLLYLDRLRGHNDTTINDVACTSIPTTPFGPYTAVPREAFAALLAQRGPTRFDSIAFEYRNLSDERKNVGRRFSITDLQGNRPLLPFSGGAQNVPPFAHERCSRSFAYDWSALAEEPVRLEFKAYLITERTPKNAPFRWNDTVRRVVEYGDAYAYDSGEPNTGYGIVGVGAERAAVAMRFAPLAPTAIRGVRLWFNPILSPGDRKGIRLTIWEDRHGMPGRMLRQELVSPPPAEAQGQFVYYELAEPLRFDTPLHVGWTQTSADMVNVGYDRSVEYVPTVHYKTTGPWEPSAAKGTLLLRLVCGGEGTYPPDEPTDGTCATQSESGIYPNPASEWLHVACTAQGATASLHNLQGHTVRSGLPCNVPIGVQDLPQGIYVLRIVSRDGAPIATHRLVKQ